MKATIEALEKIMSAYKNWEALDKKMSYAIHLSVRYENTGKYEKAKRTSEIWSSTYEVRIAHELDIIRMVNEFLEEFGVQFNEKGYFHPVGDILKKLVGIKTAAAETMKEDIVDRERFIK